MRRLSVSLAVFVVGIFAFFGCAEESVPPSIPEAQEETNSSADTASGASDVSEVSDSSQDVVSPSENDVESPADGVEIDDSLSSGDTVSEIDATDVADSGDAGDSEDGGEADVDWGPGPGCSFPYGSTVTVRVLDDGSLAPAYGVSHPAVESVAYTYDGQAVLKAIDEAGEEWWSVDIGPGTVFGGFDFDQDGWPDKGIVRSSPTTETCGTETVMETSIDFIRGFTGEVLSPIAPLKDKCWEFPDSTYPTSQWTNLSVLHGGSPSGMVISPYYSTNSWFLSYDEDWNLNSFIYPSTVSFDATYPNAKESAWETGQAYVEDSHAANGLVVDSAEGQRLVFFTSGRVLQYALGTYGADQLVVDHPFLTGNRKDLAGRNYGLVAVDPAYPQHVALLAGTDVFTLFLDLITDSQEADEWGGIERHVAIYNTGTDALDDRFYSSAHDAQDGHKYVKRVVYPAQPFVPTGNELEPSRIAYNVYDAGRWHLHISEPGSTEDREVLSGLFLWNIQDLDGNGTLEWVISPTDAGGDDVVTPAYHPTWETQLYQWDESELELKLAKIYEDRVPYLIPSDTRATASTSRGALYPLLVAEIDCALYLGLRNSTGELEWEPLAQ